MWRLPQKLRKYPYLRCQSYWLLEKPTFLLWMLFRGLVVKVIQVSEDSCEGLSCLTGKFLCYDMFVFATAQLLTSHWWNWNIQSILDYMAINTLIHCIFQSSFLMSWKVIMIKKKSSSNHLLTIYHMPDCSWKFTCALPTPMAS